MIIGDPFNFAIYFDVVDIWNEKDQHWKSGLFSMYIGGVQLPPKLDVAELRTSIATYTGWDFTVFKEHEIDPFMLARYHSVIKNHITQEITEEEQVLFEAGKILVLNCTTMEDQNCWAFLIKTAVNEESVVWTVDDGNIISKIALPLGTVESVISILSVDLLL